MKREEFEAFVAKLEPYARDNPRGYALRVGGLALLGYLYLVGLLLLLVLVSIVLIGLLFVSIGFLKLTIIGCIATFSLIAVILKSLLVRIPPPEGVELRPADVPALSNMIEDLRRQLRARPFHHLLLTDQFNAAVAQVPQLGILGWQRNYLLIGLPLIEALSPEQFRAVVAHELGHLSANHSQFAGWIYRVRRTWQNVYQNLARLGQRQRVDLFSKFIQWYWPYFNGYSFVLARANEYTADRCAVELTSREATGSALVSVSIYGRYLHEVFWKELTARATREPAPPAKVFNELADTLRQPPSPQEAQKWLTTAFLVETNTADTHPCLKDRLAAFGYQHPEGVVPPPAPVSAAQEYLGPLAAHWRQVFNARWSAAKAELWKKRYAEVRQIEERLVAVGSGAPETPLTVAQKWEKCQLLAKLEGDQAAEVLLREILASEPAHPGANFMYGRLLLARDDAAGIGHIESVLKTQRDAAKAGHELLYGYYVRTGQRDAARDILRRHDASQEQLAALQQELARVTVNDTFVPALLTQAALKPLQTALATHADIGSAYLFRRQLRQQPDFENYLLVIKPHRFLGFKLSAASDTQLLQRVAKQLPCPPNTRIYILNQRSAWLNHVIARVPHCQIHQRA